MQFFQLWVVKLHLTLQWKLRKKEFLKKYKIELIGANSKAISNAEDRKNLEKI
jgi:carbamoyl-phosphate synthase large subunit